MELGVFLNTKPLYYKEIDHQRVHLAYAMLKPQIEHPLTVHIVGTNGKGSTGRTIAHLAHSEGLLVGHYSSPHILKFNERIWLDGKDVCDEVLENAHQKLFTLLGDKVADTLSYFEYTTLLAFVVFEKCDLMVLEAGLGGEFDATNVCDKALSVITPIGIDHQAFLGNTIEEIAHTKINSIQNKVLVAPQVYDEVFKIAKEIVEQKDATLFTRNNYIDTRVDKIANEKGWGNYLVENISVALKALDILEIDYNIGALKTLELFGRFYPLAPNVYIDVGHNPLAAQAIEKTLKKQVVLIYNSLEDKDYEKVLETLKPKIKRVEILPIASQRATTLGEIEKALETVGMEYSYFNNEINEDETYLVFGSFYVVEAFLKLRKYSI